MSLISFDPPKKLRSTAEHSAMYSSDSGIAGTYVPNMSEEDMKRWKGKHINRGKPNARIEIRKTMSSDILLIVALDGWDYGHESSTHAGWSRESQTGGTKGLNVRMSMNGPIKATFDQFAEIQAVVEEARSILLTTKDEKRTK